VTPPARLQLTVDETDRHRTLTLGDTSMGALALVLAVVPHPDPYHAVIHHLHLMAPSCGLTRASVAITTGHPAGAIALNPAVVIIALLGAGWILREVVGRLHHRWLTVHIRLGVVGWIAAGLALLALGAYQTSRFDWLIRQGFR
jgi:Protein of unknown function (DUF2752)